MPATSSRIGFITNQFRRSIVENSAVLSQYGAVARKSEDPVETFFDDVDDAELVNQERLDLLSAARRRFAVSFDDTDEIADLPVGGAVPVVRYVDAERGVDRNMIVCEIIIDLNKNSAAMPLWG